MNLQARIQCVFLLLGFYFCWSVSHDAVAQPPASAATFSHVQRDIKSEVQLRPCFDSTLAYQKPSLRLAALDGETIPLRPLGSGFPLIEVFLTNLSTNTIRFSDAITISKDRHEYARGRLVWKQLYPSPHVAPGETILFQMCLVDNPTEEEPITLVREGGEPVMVKVQPFAAPRWRIENVGFDREMRSLFITFSPWQSEAGEGSSTGVPRLIVVNGKDCTSNTRVLEKPGRQMPGLIEVILPAGIGWGKLVHVALEFADGQKAQTLIRGWNDICLDAFDLPDDRVRPALGLDPRPWLSMLPSDPACEEVTGGDAHGYTAQSLLKQRLEALNSETGKLSYVFLCTTARPQVTFPIYGQFADALGVAPYRLSFPKSSEEFIEQEENYFLWAKEAAQPRPWGWLVNAFTRNQRCLETRELRMLACSALGHGCKFISYYSYRDYGTTDKGFSSIPSLQKAIVTVNREIARIRPLLACSVPAFVKTEGDKQTGARLYGLFCGRSDLLVFIRNLDYYTDTRANSLGAKPRFHSTPKKQFHARFPLPRHLDVASVSDGLTKRTLKWSKTEGELEVQLDVLDDCRVVVVKGKS